MNGLHAFLPHMRAHGEPAHIFNTASAAGLDVASMTESGTDPASIGDQVVAAVKAGEFYVFTHLEIQPIFESRFHRILAGTISS